MDKTSSYRQSLFYFSLRSFFTSKGERLVNNSLATLAPKSVRADAPMQKFSEWHVLAV